MNIGRLILKRVAIPAFISVAIMCPQFCFANTANNTSIEPRIKSDDVLDTYKSFHNGVFAVARYGETYRLLTFPNGYALASVDLYAIEEGYYQNYYGYISRYKCNYDVW